MNELYPLCFQPIFKERIWGGGKFKSEYNLPEAPADLCGEAWLISGLTGNNSVVSNGYLAGNELGELIEIFMGDLVGDRVYEQFQDNFPLLIKLLDSNDWLSLQVHPPDALAYERYAEAGKSELWYVLQAAAESRLISGFRKSTSREHFLELMSNGLLEEYLNYEKVVKGDVFHLPAGRIHALGPGVVLAEIQQSSDRTYRLHDWGRVDVNGQSRELHLEKAIDALDFNALQSAKTHFDKKENRSNTILNAPYFSTNYLHLTQAIVKDYEELDSFVIFVCIDGKVDVTAVGRTETLRAGEALLLPNIIDNVSLIPDAEATLLETYIR